MKLQDNIFNIVYDRRSSGSHKWHNVPAGVPSMWLADMDFRAPEPLLQALKDQAADGFYGYPLLGDEYSNIVQEWFVQRHHYPRQKISMIPVTGIIPALSVIIQQYSEEGEGIIIQAPVYYRFQEIISRQRRTVLINDLIEGSDGQYYMNFDRLSDLKEYQPRIFVLCSPHNPIGRVWAYEDLLKIADFCLQNNILLVADEIHCDIVLPGNTFYSVAVLPEKYLSNMIILTSSTKTFNIAGLRGGHLFVFNSEISRELPPLFDTYGINKINTAFVTATKAGYRYCGGWVDMLNEYILHNYLYVVSFMKNEIPLIKVGRHMATYLLWLDYSALAISEDAFFKELNGDILLSRGSVFSKDATGFFRMNIACPKETIVKALCILKYKVNKLLK